MSSLRCPNCGNKLIHGFTKNRQHCLECGFIVEDADIAIFDNIQNKQTEESVGVPKTE